MNYRHAFHAGNHADALKHFALIVALERLARKPSPFAVLDTHAGVGLYDLASDEARRSPEWAGGIARLWDWAGAPPALAPYLAAVRALNPDGALRFYPGSPALIAAALRPRDRLAACELHPEDAQTLKARFARQSNVHIHPRDGWEALGALLPPPEKRGLVLIDPPYEAAGELERGAEAIRASLKRFGHGAYLWWRPMKSAAALDRVDADLAGAGRAWLRADLWVDAVEPAGKLAGSSILALNPPFGLSEALAQALPELAARLALSQHAGWRLEAGGAG